MQFVYVVFVIFGLVFDDVDDFIIVFVYLEFFIKFDDFNGVMVIVEGIIQQVIVKMDIDYFGWNQMFQVGLGDVSYVSVLLVVLVVFEGLIYDCKIKIDMVNSLVIKWGIYYLCVILGKVKNGFGFKNCGCVSCLWDFVIYWCNEVCCYVFLLCVMMFDRSNIMQDFFGDKEFYWGQIVDLVQDIFDNCVGLIKVKG